MDPDVFWRLTPGEFEERLKGWARRENAEWERFAWLAAHILNIEGKSLKKGVTMTADKLLGRKGARGRAAQPRA